MNDRNSLRRSSGSSGLRNVTHGEAVAAARLLVKIQSIKGIESDPRLVALAQERAQPSPAFRPSRREMIAAAKALVRSNELHGIASDPRVVALAQLDDGFWRGTRKVDGENNPRSSRFGSWLSRLGRRGRNGESR